jgi:hypothetical protein
VKKDPNIVEIGVDEFTPEQQTNIAKAVAIAEAKLQLIEAGVPADQLDRYSFTVVVGPPLTEEESAGLAAVAEYEAEHGAIPTDALAEADAVLDDVGIRTSVAARASRRRTMIELARFLDDARKMRGRIRRLYPDMRKVPVKARPAIKLSLESLDDMVASIGAMMTQEIDRNRVRPMDS